MAARETVALLERVQIPSATPDLTLGVLPGFYRDKYRNKKGLRT